MWILRAARAGASFVSAARGLATTGSASSLARPTTCTNIADKRVSAAIAASPSVPRAVGTTTRANRVSALYSPNKGWSRAGFSSQAGTAGLLVDFNIDSDRPVERQDNYVKFFVGELGMSEVAARELIRINSPRMQTMSIRKARATTAYFIDEIGLTRAQMCALLKRFIRVLEYSIPLKIDAIMSYFDAEVGMATKDVAAMVVKFPQIFGLNLPKNISPTVQFVKDNITGDNAEDLARVLKSFPQIFGLRDDNWPQKMSFFDNHLHLSREDRTKMICRFPQLLGLDPAKNLIPTHTYIVEEMDGNEETIVSSPSILGHSLQHRIKPRHQFALSLGVKKSADRLIRTSQKVYCKELGVTEAEYEEWLRANGYKI